MPSGITSAIYEGKDVTLRDYLMQVGRSMSMAIMQREDDQDEPVKLRQESKYPRLYVAEHQAELDRLRTMSPSEAEHAARQEFTEATKRYEKTRADKVSLRKRYEDMLSQVEAWEPDPKVAYLKDQAAKYLRESIDFDVGRDGEDMRYYPKPERLTGPVWLKTKVADEERSLERAKKTVVEEIERVADFNGHIEAFLRSLPDV